MFGLINLYADKTELVDKKLYDKTKIELENKNTDLEILKNEITRMKIRKVNKLKKKELTNLPPHLPPKRKKPCKSFDLQGFTFQICGPTRARTLDPLIMSQVL